MLFGALPYSTGFVSIFVSTDKLNSPFSVRSFIGINTLNFSPGSKSLVSWFCRFVNFIPPKSWLLSLLNVMWYDVIVVSADTENVFDK